MAVGYYHPLYARRYPGAQLQLTEIDGHR